jgi:hypothetical protein
MKDNPAVLFPSTRTIQMKLNSGRNPAELAGVADVLAILGDIDASQAGQILDLAPTIAELEEAAVWLSGGGDRLSRQQHPLDGKVAEIYDILVSEDDEDIRPQPQ